MALDEGFEGFEVDVADVVHSSVDLAEINAEKGQFVTI